VLVTSEMPWEIGGSWWGTGFRLRSTGIPRYLNLARGSHHRPWTVDRGPWPVDLTTDRRPWIRCGLCARMFSDQCQFGGHISLNLSALERACPLRVRRPFASPQVTRFGGGKQMLQGCAGSSRFS